MQFIELCRDGSIMSLEQVTVNIKYDAHRCVAQPAGDALGVNAAGNQPGNVGMSEVVNSAWATNRCLDSGDPIPAPEAGRSDWSAVRGLENVLADRLGEVVLQRSGQECGEFHPPDRFVGFWSSRYQAAPDLG